MHPDQIHNLTIIKIITLEAFYRQGEAIHGAQNSIRDFTKIFQLPINLMPTP